MARPNHESGKQWRSWAYTLKCHTTLSLMSVRNEPFSARSLKNISSLCSCGSLYPKDSSSLVWFSNLGDVYSFWGLSWRGIFFREPWNMFFIAVTKCQLKYNVREERFLWVHGLRGYRSSWWESMVIAGFMAARVCGSCLIMPQWTRKQRGRTRERARGGREGETGTMGRAGL